MKNIKIISLLAGLLISGLIHAQSGEEELSLNGYWKFHTIYGEGSNYLNIHKTENDIVIDNNALNVVRQGKWKTLKKAARNSKFYGEDYLQHYFALTDLGEGNKIDSSYVRYFPDFIQSGYYEVFTKYPFSSHLTAKYNIKHAKGISSKFVSQRVFCNEWNSLGIYEFNSKDNSYVELSAIVSGAVAADAVMFREISKEKYLEAKGEPNQVFLSNFDDSDWYDLKVPGHWGMINDFSNYTGIGWYRKMIDIPTTWTKKSNERYYLKFGGVYHLAKVYVNGKFIGKNRGGFTPFEFDVTEALNYNGKNVIAVQADNRAIVGATWNWGGIIRDVTLTKNYELRIDYQYIHAEPNLETGDAELKLMVKIENNSSQKRRVKLKSEIIDQIKLKELKAEFDIEANSQKKIYLNTELKAKNVELWHFDNPKLYQVQTTLSEGRSILSQKQDNFGIRKVELTNSKMLLNGEPVRLAGFNRVSEHRFWGSSEPIEVLEKDVDLLKEAGANFMRIMHGTQNKKLIDLCDRKGIMIFEEINVRDLDNDEFRANYYPVSKLEEEKGIKLNTEDEEILMLDEAYVMLKEKHGINVSGKNYFLAKYWLKGMIERDINHPSIIGWSVGNELNNHFEYVKAAINYVKKELDPYRLLTCVSNSGQKKEYTPKTDPNTFVDIIMHNMYRWQGDPQQILTTLRTKWPHKPVFISEFGFDPFPSTALDSDKEIFSKWTTNFRNKNEFVIGASMWTFNDYRSGYAGTTAEENRVWGVITSWRQKRRLFDRIKREHAPVKDIDIYNINFENNTAKVRIPIRGKKDYPSYAMYNYKLVYQFKNKKGKIVYNNYINLPALKPGDKDWEANISWEPLASDILDLSISLVTPTNYSRLDKTISFQNPITPEISEIISGKNAVRIFFNKVPNASEYFVKYSGNGIKDKESYKTISNYLDIKNMSGTGKYSFQLFAVNDKGISKPSKQVKAELTSNILPPVVWDAFINDNKLIVGYSGEWDDINYTLRYGSSKNMLNKSKVSNTKGMMIVPLNGEKKLFFQIQRQTKLSKSGWSNIVEAK